MRAYRKSLSEIKLIILPNPYQIILSELLIGYIYYLKIQTKVRPPKTISSVIHDTYDTSALGINLIWELANVHLSLRKIEWNDFKHINLLGSTIQIGQCNRLLNM